MKILRLAQSRVLLWASERGSDVPFEVSKVVNQPLQSRCPTAPRCPGEVLQAADGWPTGPRTEAGAPKANGSLWLDPQARPHGSCAYHFETRGDCLQTRNQLALEAALFRPSEVVLTRRLLEALGYRVEEESLDTTVSERILDAHGPIGPRHQVKLMRSPSAGQVVLVRRLPAQVAQPAPAQPQPGRTPFTVLPAGSNP